jgi:hypothetical protein
MMVEVVLGMAQGHSCHISTSPETSWNGGMSDPRVCPPIVSGYEMVISTGKDGP